MDADSGSGIIAGIVATHKAIDLAKQHGIGVVAVKNSNHFGAASVYGDIIAKHNLIGIVTSSAAPRVVPFNGKEKLFGTDPFCFTVPINDTEIFSLDMATSQICYSQVKEYRSRNLELETNWAVDAEGDPTVNPSEFSSLTPLGGYKGQGLSMMVQILSSLLAGGLFDFQLSHLDEEPYNKGRGISHFFMALDINAFIPLAIFKKNMQEYISYIKNAESVAGAEIMFAGEPQQREAQERRMSGIPLSDKDYDALKKIEEELAVQ